MINHVILSALWYILSLWVGNDKELKELEKIIAHFLWFGQLEMMAQGQSINNRSPSWPRSAWTNFHTPSGKGPCRKNHLMGYLGWIPWSLAAHALQGFCGMSLCKWGLDDFSWIFSLCNTLPCEASLVVNQLCIAWNWSKRHLIHRAPANKSNICLSLWSHNVSHRANTVVGCWSNQ